MFLDPTIGRRRHLSVMGIYRSGPHNLRHASQHWHLGDSVLGAGAGRARHGEEANSMGPFTRGANLRSDGDAVVDTAPYCW